jgi:hypothetical protein
MLDYGVGIETYSSFGLTGSVIPVLRNHRFLNTGGVTTL